ncbi:MAG: 4-hydroxythreonine-4-phosphate dehydrogenase PdxA [Bacteroidetes bacterium GWA2_31_9]|nr:MAG: 4-hydroxythreonine-4-phosphate dehydrogenase PdxA [Bacteroidetes bacterium GWA2_31_9]
MKKELIKIGITQGDINGIGYEVIIKTLLEPHIYDFCIPVIYGSSKVASYHRKALNLEQFQLNQVRNADEAMPRKANIINCVDENIKVELGKSTIIAGEASLMALEKATEDLKNNKIQALVTAPVNKDNMQSPHFKFPGHTEYFTHNFNIKESLMFMVSDVLKIGLVTNHVPISQVSESITIDKILTKIMLMNDSLMKDFGIRKPRIAVLGLNPHAGDNSLLGTEEKHIIEPAIKKAQQDNMLVFGPYGSDGFFGAGNHTKFDGVLAMYHDQGLLPFKTLCFDDGVNYTAGMPVVRTSPAHGTAYEIVGTNVANEASFRSALYMAYDIYNNRKSHKEMNANPLQVQDRTTVNRA